MSNPEDPTHPNLAIYKTFEREGGDPGVIHMGPFKLPPLPEGVTVPEGERDPRLGPPMVFEVPENGDPIRVTPLEPTSPNSRFQDVASQIFLAANPHLVPCNPTPDPPGTPLPVPSASRSLPASERRPCGFKNRFKKSKSNDNAIANALSAFADRGARAGKSGAGSEIVPVNEEKKDCMLIESGEQIEDADEVKADEEEIQKNTGAEPSVGAAQDADDASVSVAEPKGMDNPKEDDAGKKKADAEKGDAMTAGAALHDIPAESKAAATSLVPPVTATTEGAAVEGDVESGNGSEQCSKGTEDRGADADEFVSQR